MLKRNINEIEAGAIYGRLTLVSRAETYDKRTRKWNCVCICGNRKVISLWNLISGHTKSCGCWKSENIVKIATRHGMSHSPEYVTWRAMLSRCYNRNHDKYSYYGGRGIGVEKRWHTFEKFYEDMGKRPFEKASIDRINVDGNYGPSNCKWSTHVEQCNNTRVNVLLTSNGRTQSMALWARELGVPLRLLSVRKFRGWTDGEILETKKRSHKTKTQNE